MLNITQWRSAYPELNEADDTLVQVFLDRAANRIDPAAWGKWTDEAHGLLTAHLLVNSPGGQMARLASEKGESTYGKDYFRLRDEATCGLGRVP